MKRIYLDHASLTPISKPVLKEIKKYSKQEFGNPSSIYAEGVASKKALTDARKNAAAFLRALPDEIVFTSGGTEANNMAILGFFKHLVLKEGKNPKELHAVFSAIEHQSVLECARHLKEIGVSVDFVKVDEEGAVDLKELKEKITPKTFLVSVMLANNEVGTIEPIAEIAKIIRHARKTNNASWPFFHTDAAQAPLYLELNVEKLGVDLLTLDAQKINGPRGAGLLYKKRGVELAPILYGGGQEGGLRSGTENVPGIMGFSKAIEMASKDREKETSRIAELRDYFLEELLKIQGVVSNGSKTSRLPNNISISVLKDDFDPEFFVLKLDAKGIVASTKSACLKDEDESYVLRSMFSDGKRAKTSVRFTLGKGNSKRDIKYALKAVRKILVS